MDKLDIMATNTENNMEFNRHHTLFPRTAYNRYETSRALRQHPAMIHRIPVIDHKELHANVESPLLISKTLGRVALQFLDSQPSHYMDIERYISLIDKFKSLSKGLGKTAIEAGSLSENLFEQLGYMENIDE